MTAVGDAGVDRWKADHDGVIEVLACDPAVLDEAPSRAVMG